MKALFTALLITFSVSTFADSSPDGVTHSGAWYCTKAPSARQRAAGQIDFTFRTDGTMTVLLWWLDDVFEEIVSTYTVDARGNFRFRFVDSDSWIYTGTAKGNFVSGSFKGTGYGGRFQAIYWNESW